MPQSKTRYVVFRTPGPQWQSGIDYREQPGVMEHVTHYQQLFDQNKLELGGPFLADGKGGMMISTADASREEIEAFAKSDPAVVAGLLIFEVVEWFVAMNRQE